MPGVIIHHGMADYSRWARELGRSFASSLHRGTVSGAARCITVMQKATRYAKPASLRGGEGAVNTGAYLGAWRSTALQPVGASIFNSKLHAAIIEDGRRPGRLPPLAIIMRWAQRRLGLSQEEAKRAAWPIGRAIKARGLLPRHVMLDAQPELEEVVLEEQIRELDAGLGSRAG